MSQEIPTHFVQQFRSSLELLAQQRPSRLRNTVTEEAVTGQTAWYDQIGVTSASAIETRHGDTPIANIPHRRRRIDLRSYNVGELVDGIDKVKLIADPTSAYAVAMNGAMNRQIDDLIIGALFATANTGADGSTLVTWPPAAAQVIAVNSWAYGSGSGNSGLTISKLLEAKAYFAAQEEIGRAHV